MPLVFSLNVPLAPMTTLKVGGPAKYFAEIRTEEEVQEAFRFAREKNLPVFVLGGGSNIVIADAGFPGLVLRNELKGFREEGEADGKVLVAAASGEDWDALVVYAVDRNLAGIENMSGVPGTVGSAPVQNVACYGQSVSEVIREVRGVDMRTGERKGWLEQRGVPIPVPRQPVPFRGAGQIFRDRGGGRARARRQGEPLQLSRCGQVCREFGPCAIPYGGAPGDPRDPREERHDRSAGA